MALNFIHNRSVRSASGQTLPVIDPADGQPYDSIERSNAADVDAAVQAARRCLEGPWARLTAAERGRLLMKLSAQVAEHADELAAIEQRDCGKPTKQAKADALALVRYFEFYAGAGDKLHGHTIPYLDGYSVLTWHEPHGVTGHVIPWNYPMQIFGRSVGGALAAGNVCVVKPSEDACLSLLRVAELAAEVGFPPGAINIVTGYGHEVGDALARHPGIDHISFTGSPRVGTLIQQAAAERHCPVTLELGGKGPQIVFDDADVDAALPFIINAIVQNSGQTCSAGSRLLVQRGLYEPLLQRLGEAFKGLRAGPPGMDLDLGPLIRETQQQRFAASSTRSSATACPSSRKARSTRPPMRTATTPRPPWCATCRRSTAWRRKRSSAPCSRPCRSLTKTRRFNWPTARPSAWWPACGRAMARVHCAWPSACTAARSSSTTTARPAAWNCPSAACAPVVTAARRASKA
jgi:aldehyde dehydrogenase (NAD+)